MRYINLLILGEPLSIKSYFSSKLNMMYDCMKYYYSMETLEMNRINYNQTFCYYLKDLWIHLMSPDCCLLFFDLSVERSQTYLLYKLTKYIFSVREVCTHPRWEIYQC